MQLWSGDTEGTPPQVAGEPDDDQAMDEADVNDDDLLGKQDDDYEFDDTEMSASERRDLERWAANIAYANASGEVTEDDYNDALDYVYRWADES